MKRTFHTSSEDRTWSIVYIVLLTLGLVIYLFPILTCKYFLTVDGPAHVYNSRLLKDWILGEHLDFYQKFYFDHFKPDPNWMDHALLSSLMVVFPSNIAEKILLTVYVLGFGVGILSLIYHINRENIFLVFLGLPFIYHFTFFNGFWNSSLSLVLGIWVIVWWNFHYRKFTASSVITGLVLITPLYFTHLLGLGMALMVMGGTWLMEYVANLQQKNMNARQLLFKRLMLAVVVALPAVMLVANFIYTKGLNQIQSSVNPKILFDQYVILTGLKSIGAEPYETVFVKIIAFTFHLLLVWGIIVKVKTRAISKYDGFLLAFIIILYFYLNLPEAIVGGSVLIKRVQIVPYVLLIGWLAQFTFPQVIRKGFAILLFIVSVGLVVSRMPAHHRNNQGVKEYLSVLPYIEPESTVLPLSYNHNGLDEDTSVLSKMWLFMHAGDYLGAEKPLVLLSNYEASSGAFPLIYHYNQNPFILIGKNEGIEFQPPSVDLTRFQRETGYPIDYVVTWCRNLTDQTHPYWIDADQQLKEHYDLIYTSQRGRVELFRLKE